MYYMHSTVRHYSVISALSLALILAFSLVSNAYALFPPMSQIGSIGNSLQQDDDNEDENDNQNQQGDEEHDDNHGKGNKHSSNNSSDENDDEKNAKQDDNKGKNGDHGNKGHGKKLKL